MKIFQIAAIAGLLAALSVSNVQADFNQAARAKHGGPEKHQQSHKQDHQQYGHAQHSKQKSRHQTRRYDDRRGQRQVIILPPRQTLHTHVRQQRHHIGKGRALPQHVYIMRGKPLPPGWGKRLSREQSRHLPHYSGYEWRRAGSDMVLVTAATGLVQEILVNVLN